ncbi:MAG TPA: signal peptide peptidase SppA [Pseudogracilibacillus sp.]|nr:signal peptide peptidase SppA [Pseudogracilibacillus sp.]
MMNGKRWTALAVAIVLFVVSLGVQLTTTVTSGIMSSVEKLDFDLDALDEYVIEQGDWDRRIAVLHLEGVIMDSGLSPLLADTYDHQSFLNMIEQAATDSSVEAVLLHVDSPGGGVTESAAIHRKLVELQEVYGKPLYVSMGSMAASGGYYVSAPADKIFAEPSTITGSIGVIMENINYSKLAENYGVEFNTIKSGKHKDIMSPNRDMTKEEKDILQSMIDEMYEDFVDVIVAGRDMSEQEVKEIGDGRIYTGRQALDNGLVDEVGSFDDALATLQSDLGLENAEIFEYGYGLGFLSTFFQKIESAIPSQRADLEIVMNLLRQSDQPRAMYIY